MEKNDFIRARTNKSLKQEASAILDTIGLNMTDAINLYLKQITLYNGLPFEVKIPNEETIQAIKEMKGSEKESISLEEFKQSLGL
jgi:DNA-damage-inducible protein J